MSPQLELDLSLEFLGFRRPSETQDRFASKRIHNCRPSVDTGELTVTEPCIEAPSVAAETILDVQS
jgi:hypothetical protein